MTGVSTFRVVAIMACASLVCPSGFGQKEDGYSANERILRIRELGKKGPTVLPSLAQYLSDKDRDIRVEAVKAIVKIGTEASLDPLVQAARDSDSEVQIRATDGLVNAYLPGYAAKSGVSGLLTRGVRQVKSFFASRNDQVVDPAVVIRPDVAQALSDEIGGGSSTDVRANAALASGILRNHQAVPALSQALHSRDSELIFESLVALQKIREPSAGPSISFLTHDLDDRIQITSLETIGVLRSLPSAPDVRAVVRDPRNIKVRRAAIQALAMLGISGDRPIFQQYANDSDVATRVSALEGLARIREPEDTPLLQQIYDEPNADGRIHLAAAFGLVSEGKVDTAEFSPLPYLFEGLELKGRSDVSAAYLSELARREDVRNTLAGMIPQATKDQKIALCSIFGSTRDPAVIPILTKLANDIDPNVAFAASKELRSVQRVNAS